MSDPAFLVRYGRPGFVGRFRSAEALARGDRVVVRGPRGVEFGEVLVEPAGRFIPALDDGTVLRVPTAEDDAAIERLEEHGGELLAAAADRAAECGLAMAFVDIELTLDGTAILHALPWAACDATQLLDELATRFGLAVRLMDLSRSPVPVPETTSGGCGKPGCGTESAGCSSCGTGGGCSTGSCSRGSVKSADDLTAYFADLRGKMEAAARTPLN